MADGDVTHLTDDEIDTLPDEERDTLNEADGDTDRDTGPDEEEEVDLRPAFIRWVMEHFAIVEVVGTKDRAPWCDRWYDHPEVVARLFAAWQAHLQARQEENMEASSNWWLSHWDRHAAVLFDRQNGPFRACTSREGHLAERKTGTTQVIIPTVPGPDWVL